jgi:hypothetical protein
MLNELYDAASTLGGVGIKPKNWHKEYVPIRAPKLAFFVYINNQGEIADLERIGDPTEVADLRTWESKGGPRQSFPYFNIPPLMWIRTPGSVEHDHLKKARMSDKLTQEQLGEFTESAKRWDAKSYKKLLSNLEKGKALKAILGQAPREYQSVIALIDRLANTSAENFYAKLCQAFTDKVLGCPEKYFDGLIYSGAKEPGNDVTLLLELVDGASRFEFPVKHQKVREWVNERLLAQNSARDDSARIHDIFGSDSLGWDQPFDDVRIKNVLGNVKLRAMAAAAKCQYRYGKAEADSCPVGQESRSKMKGALEWLIDPEREGKTWTTVSRAAGNKEVLLAYPSVLPPEPPDTATFFGGFPESDADNTGRFENCAKNVIGTLHGLMAKNRNLDIRVFVLRKMDSARTRVSSHRRYSAQHLLRAAELWQQGCRNLPQIVVKRFTNEKKTEWREPQTPFPMEVVWTLNTNWSRGRKGAEKNKSTSQPQWAPSATKDFTTDDGISLLLEEGASLRPILQRLFYGVTHNGAGLVLALGQAHAQGQVFVAAKNYMRQPIILPSILGLLLFKMKVTKEQYMKSAPYLVGRLLSLADQLHYHYCQHVRDGSVPPQLMGNALMPTALEEPVKALALYSNRILPYQAWAKTVSGDAAGLARYFLAELGKVSDALKTIPAIPERCTDSDKAQMLIGYLARPEKSDSDITQ